MEEDILVCSKVLVGSNFVEGSKELDNIVLVRTLAYSMDRDRSSSLLT